MNFNLIGYLIYLPITVFITVAVGRRIHRYGIHFICNVIKDETITNSINNLLLIGYYLVNIGYALIAIIFWDTILSVSQLIEELSLRIGTIILLLTFLHYFNILVIGQWEKIKIYYKLKT